MEIIHTENAPKAIGPYSQAVKFDRFVYTSGQIPLTKEGDLVQGGVKEQVEQVFRNLDAVLEAAGARRNQVVKATIFMTDLAEFQVVNEACQSFFGDHKPARSTVQVAALPRGAKVEIELVAYLG